MNDAIFCEGCGYSLREGKPGLLLDEAKAWADTFQSISMGWAQHERRRRGLSADDLRVLESLGVPLPLEDRGDPWIFCVTWSKERGMPKSMWITSGERGSKFMWGMGRSNDGQTSVQTLIATRSTLYALPLQWKRGKYTEYLQRWPYTSLAAAEYQLPGWAKLWTKEGKVLRLRFRPPVSGLYRLSLTVSAATQQESGLHPLVADKALRDLRGRELSFSEVVAGFIERIVAVGLG